MTGILDRALGLLRRAAATPMLRLGLFAAIALCASWRPLGEAGALNEFRDSHLVHTYEDVAVRTVLEHGEAPLWNPWSCGGMYALGNPQTRFTSPTLLMSLAFGARRAEPLFLFLFLVLGMEGMFRFARIRTGSALGPLVAAPFYALTGYVAVSWTLGWLIFLGGFLLIPWALYGTSRLSRGDARGAVPLVLSAALMLALGGSYPLALTVVFAALEAARGLVPRLRRAPKSLLRPIGLLVGAGLLTAGVCAVRLWPVMETFGAAPRVMAGRPGHSLAELVQMLFTPAAGAKNDQAIFFIGPAVALLALAGLVLCWRRALWPLLVFAFAVWCATGYASQVPVFGWLRQLPVFESLRYPERFLFPGIAFLAEAAAVGVTALLVFSRRKRQPWRQLAGAAALVACAIGAAGWAWGVFNFDVLAQRSELGPIPPRVDQPFAQSRGNRWIAGHVFALNRGSIACGEAYPVWMSPELRGDLAQEEYLEDPSAGTVQRAHWSPNRLELDVSLSRPAVVRVNQNWHPGWKSSMGEVVDREGLLSVSLPEGQHRVELRFRPRSGIGGAWVSLVGLCALAAWRVIARRRPSWTVASGVLLGLLPLTVWAGIGALWKEPKAPLLLQNQDGSPLVVDGVPTDATGVGAQFGVPVELLAAKVAQGPDENREVPIELYWRVHGKVPRSVGVFVHVIGPGGRRVGADHEVLGGTFFFATAPKDQIIRDAFRLNTAGWPRGSWNVVVGLWNADGDGSRIGARTSSGVEHPDGRVEVGILQVF